MILAWNWMDGAQHLNLLTSLTDFWNQVAINYKPSYRRMEKEKEAKGRRKNWSWLDL